MALKWQGSAWPPEQDRERLARYARAELLFEGDHARAFEETGAKAKFGRKLIYLTLNYAGLISKLAADLLVGETPVFRAPDGLAADSLKEIIGRPALKDGEEDPGDCGNALPTTLYEAALSASFRGDALFRVRWGKRHPEDEKEDAIIEELPASSYFVEHDPDNVRNILSECVAWVHRVPGRKKCYLRVEEHTSGRVRNFAFGLDERSGKVGTPVDLAEVYRGLDDDGTPVEPPEAEYATGVNRSLLVHVPNFRHGSRYWGLSDYYDLEPLFDALNNRVSKTDRILDKHANPKLVLPAGSTDGGGVVRLSEMDLYEVSTAQESAAVKYVTWDGKLEAAIRHADSLIDQIFRLAEVSPAAFGLDKAGNIESGRAMRMRFIRTQAKMARKRQYFDVGTRRVLWLAQKLRQVHGGGPAPVAIEIHWMDGIPDDYNESVDVESVRIQAGLTSRESAIKRIDNVDDAQARAEIQRMQEEAQASPAPATPPAGGNGREVPPHEGETHTRAEAMAPA